MNATLWRFVCLVGVISCFPIDLANINANSIARLVPNAREKIRVKNEKPLFKNLKENAVTLEEKLYYYKKLFQALMTDEWYSERLVALIGNIFDQSLYVLEPTADLNGTTSLFQHGAVLWQNLTDLDKYLVRSKLGDSFDSYYAMPADIRDLVLNALAQGGKDAAQLIGS